MVEIDWNAILLAIIPVLPNCLWMSFIIILALIFRNHLSALFTRLTRFGAFGLEAEFGDDIRIQLERAIKTYANNDDLAMTEKHMNSVLDHAKSVYDDLQGARILWVDRTPLANANIHRFLNDLGVHIDNTDSTEQALAAMEWSAGAYEVVITNMQRRDENGEWNGRAGLELIAAIHKQIEDKQIILFITNYNPALGKPAGARIVTDQVDTLLHNVFEAIVFERRKENWNTREQQTEEAKSDDAAEVNPAPDHS